jgi:hypothetical protein
MIALSYLLTDAIRCIHSTLYKLIFRDCDNCDDEDSVLNDTSYNELLT